MVLAASTTLLEAQVLRVKSNAKRSTVTVVLIFCSEWLAGSVCSLLRQVAKGEGGILGQGKIEG